MTEPLMLFAIAALGLVAGVLGGLLGVGGSVILLPGLVILLGRETGDEQHLYQAAAMLVNVAVALPAARRHVKAGVIRKDVLKWMLPAALVFVLVGVGLSNLPFFRGGGALWLGRVLALLLLYVIYVNLKKLRVEWRAATGLKADGPNDVSPVGVSSVSADTTREVVTVSRSGALGGLMGLIAGLLGVGGGALVVPMQQVWMKLPLRTCIGNSSAVMLISAGLGAIAKNATLPASQTLGASLTIAGLLAPTAFIGSRIGAGLTHRLPIRWVRAVFVGLMLLAAWKMAMG